MTDTNHSSPQQLPRIVLIGMRGSGKTSVGRELARRLGGTFADTDQLICDSSGRTIAEIFAQEGEAAFRELEKDAVARALAGSAGFISVGGGAIASPENQSRLRRAGCVVWLTAPAEVLASRIARDPMSPSTRPALTSVGGAAGLQALLTEREPAYRATAHVVVDTAGRSAVKVTDDVIDVARRWAESNRS